MKSKNLIYRIVNNKPRKKFKNLEIATDVSEKHETRRKTS